MKIKGQRDKGYYTHEELAISIPWRNISDIDATLLILVSQHLPKAQTFPCPFRQKRFIVTHSHIPGYPHISLFLRFFSSSVNQCESTFFKHESTQTSRPGATLHTWSLPYIHLKKNQTIKNRAWRFFFEIFYEMHSPRNQSISELSTVNKTVNCFLIKKSIEIYQENVFTGALKLLFLYLTIQLTNHFQPTG